MNIQQTQRIAAVGMAGAAGLAIAGFTALGSIFDYPKILKEPTEHILAAYNENHSAITGWFLVLVIGAALLAPVGVLLGRIAGGTMGRWIAGVGIAAATVQVIGLSRWVLLVPGVSQDALVPSQTAAAQHTFEQLHFWLGTIVGETIGYALTATFTVLVVIAITRRIAPRWMSWLGYAAAGTHRHRSRHSARIRRRQHHQLRRLHRLVPVADRDGRRAVARPGRRTDRLRPCPDQRLNPTHRYPQPEEQTAMFASAVQTTIRQPINEVFASRHDRTGRGKLKSDPPGTGWPDRQRCPWGSSPRGHQREGGSSIVVSDKPGQPTAHQQALDSLIDDMARQINTPIGVIPGPWPLTGDEVGIGDDVHRALLADDWADSGMRPNQLRKLVDVQVVTRKRQLGGDHPAARDVGITVDGDVVGRILLDLDDESTPVSAGRDHPGGHCHPPGTATAGRRQRGAQDGSRGGRQRQTAGPAFRGFRHGRAELAAQGRFR